MGALVIGRTARRFADRSQRLRAPGALFDVLHRVLCGAAGRFSRSSQAAGGTETGNLRMGASYAHRGLPQSSYRHL